MKFIEAPQGTPEWYAARCGKITASCFADAVSRVGALDERQAKYVALMLGGVLKEAALKEAGYKAAPTADVVRRALAGEDTSAPSDTAKRYAADLAIERISGMPHGEPAKAWVLERGHEMETRARMLYEARTGAFITEAGICVTDDGLFGYSTDGLAGDDGLIEIKSPIDSIKIMEMWRDGDVSEYHHQMQGGMWITGRKWCDFIMYVPDLAAVGKDLYVKRIMRDEEFIDAMVLQLAQFDQMVQLYEGVFRAPAEGAVDADFTEVQTNEEPMQQDAPQTILPLLDDEPVNTTCSDVVRMLEADCRDPEEAETVIAAPAPTTAAEAVAQAKELAKADAAPSPAPVEPVIQFGDEGAPPTLKLGVICERLKFTVNAEFLAQLGFVATTEKGARLYHEGQFPLICGAIIQHITAVANQFTHP